MTKEASTTSADRARYQSAQRFLSEVFLPAIQQGTISQQETGKVDELYRKFQSENKGPGDDFRLVDVLAAALLTTENDDELLAAAMILRSVTGPWGTVDLSAKH